MRTHPSARAPDPMAEGSVDQHDPQGDEEEVGGEAEAVGEGASHERRRDHRKHLRAWGAGGSEARHGMEARQAAR